MIARVRWTTLAALALLTIACGAPRRPEMPADLILTNGAVVTEDPRHPEAQAVAVRGGSIVAVGASDEIATLAGPATRRIDLRGAMGVPGLTDSPRPGRPPRAGPADLDLH